MHTTAIASKSCLLRVCGDVRHNQKNKKIMSRHSLNFNWATVFAAIITGLVALSAPFIYDYFSKDKNYHVVVLSTKSKDEAVRKAKEYIGLGYDVTVHSSSTGYFAVSLGEYPEPKAASVRDEVKSMQAIAPPDIYLADPNGFVRPIEIQEKKCFIIVYSNTELDKVNKYAIYLQSIRCEPPPTIRRTTNNVYAVVLGEHECKTANSILSKLIEDDVVYPDSYVADDGIEDEVQIQ